MSNIFVFPTGTGKIVEFYARMVGGARRRTLAIYLRSILARYFPLYCPKYPHFQRLLPGRRARAAACGPSTVLHSRGSRMRSERSGALSSAHAQSRRGWLAPPPFPLCLNAAALWERAALQAPILGNSCGARRHCPDPVVPKEEGGSSGLAGGCFCRGIWFRRDRKAHLNSCVLIVQQRTGPKLTPRSNGRFSTFHSAAHSSGNVNGCWDIWKSTWRPGKIRNGIV